MKTKMDIVQSVYSKYQSYVDKLWEQRDRRVDGWFMMNSFWPTLILVMAYVYIVKIWGPRFMQDRKPYNISTFLVYYNAFQVALSAYIFGTVSQQKMCHLENRVISDNFSIFSFYAEDGGEITAFGANQWITQTIRNLCW